MIDRPALIPGPWRGAIVEVHDVAGELLHSVTVRLNSGKATRRWFPDRGIALAFALDQADALELPMIDLASDELEG